MEANNNTYERCILCPKCTATCNLCTSQSQKNPDRQYYKCPSDKGFVKWADQVRDQDWIDVPVCSCKAGVCRVTKVMFGPNAGRILYTCIIKEGYGSCGYSVWKDELEMSSTVVGTAENDQASLKSTLTNSDQGTNPAQTDLIDESCPNVQRLYNDDDDDELDEIIQSLSLATSMNYDDGSHESNLGDINLVVDPEIDVKEDDDPVSNLVSIDSDDDLKHCNMVEENSQCEEMPTYELLENETSHNHLQCIPASSSKIECLRSHEEQHYKSSKRPLKRSRHGYPKAPSTSISAHSFTICLDMKSVVPKKYCWMTVAISQNLSPQLQGWLGRLVFRPYPCLFSSDSQLTCDNSLVTLEKIRASSEAPMTINSINRRTIVCESSSKVPHKPVESGPLSIKSFCDVPSLPSNASREDRSDDAIAKSISKRFTQAAEDFQNDLLTLLETMDVKAHKAMSQAAEATFSALDHLPLDQRDFKERINKLIRCAKLVAEMEECMLINDSHKKLFDYCSRERMNLDSMKRARAKTLDTMTKNKNRLKAVNEQLSAAKNWIFQIEAELCCFEIEIKTMEEEFARLTKDTEALERGYLIECKKLEESQQPIEQREAVIKAAKDEFDRARLLLRG